MDWKSIVGTVAPTIATALGGPLAGIAVKAIGSVFGIEGGSEKDVAAAVANASPEQLMALKKADQDFAVRMRELDIDLERIAADDRASARGREVATGDKMVPVLAGVVLIGFFTTVGYVLAGKVELSGEAGAVIGTLIGYVSAKAEQVVSYYFGSSSGSKAKDATITAMGGR